MIIGRWNYATHSYDPYDVPIDWTIVLYTDDMDLPINCTNCGKDMVFGDGYTSRELHNPYGLGYPVCEECYEAETKRKQEAGAGGWKMKSIILCDIDGTAANIDHRRHLVEKKLTGQKVDWGTFFKEMINDTPNEWCQKLLGALDKAGYQIVFVSGRPDNYRVETELWLHKHYGHITFNELYMRPAGNHEQDYLIKERIYDEYFVASGSDKNILFVLDDRKQVTDMWRKRGLTVLQCDEGDF